MSESAQHLQLVNLIIDEVVNVVGESNRCFIMSDAADGYALSPLTEEGYRPDELSGPPQRTQRVPLQRSF